MPLTPRATTSERPLAGAALWLIVLLAVGALAACGDRSGREEVEIIRDRWGVPHLFVADQGRGGLLRLAFATGYVQAQDRLFQMDLLRHAALGRLAELFGSFTLDMDREVRRDGLSAEERQAQIDELPADVGDLLGAHIAGINAWIERLGERPDLLPADYVTLGQKPEPWAAADVVALAVFQLGIFGSAGGAEAENAALLLDLMDRFPAEEARGIFDDLFWFDDPASPTSIAAVDASPFEQEEIEPFAPAQMELLDRFGDTLRLASTALAERRDAIAETARRVGIQAGRSPAASNAILVGPELAEDGAAILLGGPQVGMFVPGFFWEVGLHGGGTDAAGVNLPVGPGISVGRTASAAFTFTSGIADQIDTYVEELDPANPRRYLFQGALRDMDCRTETIVVGGGGSVTEEFCRTVHGPVFFTDPEGRIALAHRFAVRGREFDTIIAFARMGEVRTVDDFRGLADRVSLGLNFHYADTAGTIAYFHRGLIPRRPPGIDPRLPLPGTGGFEWEGFRDPARLPAVVNPSRGYIVQWNNRPVPGFRSSDQRELWGVVDRVQALADGIEAVRAEGRRVAPDDVEAINRRVATSDIFAARIAPFLDSALARRGGGDARLAEAAALVRAWVEEGAPLVAVDGKIPHPGAAIYTELRTILQDQVFGDELGEALRRMDYPGQLVQTNTDDHGSLRSKDALLLRALEGDAAALGVSRNYFRDVSAGTGGDPDAAIVRALADALASLEARFGTREMSAWQMDGIREVLLDIGFSTPAFGTTEMDRQNRGSFNLLVQLGTPVVARVIVPPGQDGTVTAAELEAGLEPPHLRDQLRLYEAFEMRPLPFAREEIQGPIEIERLPVPDPSGRGAGTP